MQTGSGPTPDLVIVGAARSGTSALAARLGEHPRIDPGAVKEPNFYSREFDRGESWYEDLFVPRERGLIRMDASASYTYPHHPEALGRLAAAAPHARLVYAVREPIARATSHYSLYHDYFGIEPAPTFGAAVRRNPIYAGASDYARWLAAIDGCFPPEQVLVVPFPALTDPDEAALTAVCRTLLGLATLPDNPAAGALHQNQVVAFRSQSLRRLSRRLRNSRYYPVVRTRLGPHRLRKVRQLVTREVPRPATQVMLDSCGPADRRELLELARRADDAVQERLRQQDSRLGTDLLSYWRRGQAPRDRLQAD